MKRDLHSAFSVSFALALLLSFLVAVSLPGTALAKGSDGKVDKRLAEQAAQSDPNTDLSVIVVGQDAGAAVERTSGKKSGDLGLMGAVSAKVKAGDLARLAADDSVSFVAPDTPMAPLGDGGKLDPARLATLYPSIDGAPAAWTRGLDGSGVGVAVIDSGVKARDDFDGRLVQVSIPGVTAGAGDTYGHGTLVAGVLAGRSDEGRYAGVAPRARLYSLNVNKADGVHSSDVIAALGWVFLNAHRYNIRVVNLSLEETVPSSYQTSLLDLAVERLWAAGVVVVAAAGNSGAGTADFAPGNDPLVLTVGATDSADTFTAVDDSLAGFSSAGTTTDAFVKPDLLAPGRHITSTLGKDSVLWQQAPAANRISSDGGYATISGTSFAAPQAAGAAADLLEQHPDWSPDNVKWLLTLTSTPVAGSTAGALALGAAVSFAGVPGLANQGVPALVCAPTTTCTIAGSLGTVSSSWNSSSWNSSSWNSSSWNSSSWNSSSWNSSSWNSSSWNSSSWNSSSWNSSSWNSSSWNSSSWN